MKILHVVAVHSPNGAYGGPMRVALNLAEELENRGHSVEIASVALGHDDYPTSESGITLRLFRGLSVVPKFGFAGLLSPALLLWVVRNHSRYDVVHVHLGRDMITMPVARFLVSTKTPVVVQTHGMIDRSEKWLSKPLDRFFTVSTLENAFSVFYLSATELDDLISVAGTKPKYMQLKNGVKVRTGQKPSRSGRLGTEVLFMARLQKRKRPVVFVQMAANISAKFPEVQFAIAGPDEGELEHVLDAITVSRLEESISIEGAVDPSRTGERLARCDVFVLPSVNEPFPMTVIEAQAEGVPVVVTNTCGLAPLIRKYESGLVVDDSLDSLQSAVCEILNDSVLRSQMSKRAILMVSENLDIETVVDRLYQAYIAALG